MTIRRRTLLARGAATLAAWPFAGIASSLGYPRLMQGPMIGAPGARHLTVWARASGALPVQVEYSKDRAFRDTKRSVAVRATAESDYIALVRVDGLEPNMRYYYRVLVDGIPDRYQPEPYATRTAPAGVADFRVAFGSCARFVWDREQRIFDGVLRQEPDLFFWLGDNVYADTEAPQMIAEELRRQRNVERLQPLIRAVPQLAIWDDHDFGHNNSDGSRPGRQESLAVFRRYWANPAFGLPATPGVFFEYAYGGIDFFFLDGRYYRDPNSAPDGPHKTFLGREQLAWLKERLLASRAPFKVLVCGSGWSAADGPQGDTWAAFLTERNQLFDFIRDRNIDGVVLLSGDSHVGELNCIPRSEVGAYDLYDLVSSPLANAMSDSWVEQKPERRLREVYVKGPNFGLLEFHHAPVPTLTFNLHDASGASVWKPLVIEARQLRNGVRSWRGEWRGSVVARADPGRRCQGVPERQ
jgi:alkaline phosphatase D